jgi:hypothetical protein
MDDSMVRRKGELSPARLDREYPHQVLVRADHYTGSNYQTVQGFCIGLSLAPRGHSIFKDDAWHHVFCFADPADAEKFRARFGGEMFDPARRGRGRRWHMMREP